MAHKALLSHLHEAAVHLRPASLLHSHENNLPDRIDHEPPTPVTTQSKGAGRYLTSPYFQQPGKGYLKVIVKPALKVRGSPKNTSASSASWSLSHALYALLSVAS